MTENTRTDRQQKPLTRRDTVVVLAADFQRFFFSWDAPSFLQLSIESLYLVEALELFCWVDGFPTPSTSFIHGASGVIGLAKR